LMNSTTGWN